MEIGLHVGLDDVRSLGLGLDGDRATTDVAVMVVRSDAVDGLGC